MTVATHKPVDMIKFMEWLPTFNRKFDVADVQRQPRLYQAALEYARSYSGSFSYMLEMKDAALRFNQLTTGQAKGVLNCARAEALRATPKTYEAAPVPTRAKAGVTVESHEVHDDRFQAMLDRELPQLDDASEKYSPAGWGDIRDLLPNHDTEDEAECEEGQSTVIEEGTYTVVFGDVRHRITLRLSVPKWATEGNVDGKLAVSYLYGPDNTNDYKGIGFYSPSGTFNVWRSVRETISFEFEQKIEAALQVIANSDQSELREAYALKSGRCARCGRKLTVPASLHRGVGPECAKHYA